MKSGLSLQAAREENGGLLEKKETKCILGYQNGVLIIEEEIKMFEFLKGW